MGLAIKERGGRIFSIDPCYGDPAIITERQHREYEIGGPQIYGVMSLIRQYNLDGIVIPIADFSEHVLNNWDGRLFDIIFIDGAHTYEAVRIDMMWAKYTKDKAVIALDDWIIPVQKACEEYIKEHNEWVFNCEKIPRTYIKGLPNTRIERWSY
jgi:hypothetical protein